MKKPHLLLLAGTLVLGGLSASWWMQRSTTAPRPVQVTAHASTAQQTTVTTTAKPTPAATAITARSAPVRTKAATAPAKQALQSPENIPAQRFSLRAERDTLLHSKGGCTVKVPANAFVDARGRTVKGAVQLELREVLKPVDFVCGNMVTVYQGKALESGGSFCLEARANGESLALAEDKRIDMAIPTRGAKSGMKYFPGEVTGNSVEWQAPQALIAPATGQTSVDQAPDGAVVDLNFALTDLSSNAWIRLEEYRSWEAMPKAMQNDLMDIVWSGDGLMITKDSMVMAGGETVILTPGDTMHGNGWTMQEGAKSWDEAMAMNRKSGGQAPAQAMKGTNQFKVDPAANYIFQVKQLGWANIDRLMYDKRSRPVDIVTRIDNKEVGDVSISMVVKSHGMFLPGYEMKNGSYSFSHGDFEPMKLPVGVKAIVLATAYRDGRPHLAMQEITISEKLNVDLHLEPIGADDLRKELEARL
ncbi:MAG: hypothetical protein JNL05_13170 [Flavobacteriales bacterium]|nr:hypothetical protein [Flavobacteriales bacterium]